MNEAHRYKVAVWVVIASEALLFSALFALYADYHAEHAALFRAGIREDVQWIGGTNTLLLLTSSFTIACAVHLIRRGETALTRLCLAATWVLGVAFLALKIDEWVLHAHRGVSGLFWVLYFAMTGLHALHVVAGLCLVTWFLIRPRVLRVELGALYWHFVDVVWVFLWPMFYLLHG